MLMEIRKKLAAFYLGVGFWIGVGVMALLNLYKIYFRQNQYNYDWIMFGVSVVIVIVALVFRKRLIKQ
ncbi:MAG TPA: hypothetical protein VMC42_06775 [Methanoregulaceae archaeon]|nr:hypothetical protein [Methanoregulaceae archaeon]